MKKILFVLLAFAMCASFVPTASAASSTYDFTLRDIYGNAYCDGMYLVLSKAYSYAPKTAVDGYHWNVLCGGTYSGVNGFKAGISPYYQYAGIGAVMMVGDPGNGEYAYGYNVEWLVNIPYRTWTVWFSNYGSGEYVFNYGTWINGASPSHKGEGTKASTKR